MWVCLFSKLWPYRSVNLPLSEPNDLYLYYLSCLNPFLNWCGMSRMWPSICQGRCLFLNFVPEKIIWKMNVAMILDQVVFQILKTSLFYWLFYIGICFNPSNFVIKWTLPLIQHDLTLKFNMISLWNSTLSHEKYITVHRTSTIIFMILRLACIF